MASTSKKPSATTAVTIDNDPLLVAINEYRFGEDAYDELPAHLAEDEQEAEFNRLVGEPLGRLESWTSPASSLDGALAALRVAMAELAQNDDEPLAASMVRAATSYFEDAAPAGRRRTRVAVGASMAPVQ